MRDGVAVRVGEVVGETAEHELIHTVPVNVPPAGQLYTGDAACVIVQVEPERVPPLGQL